MSDPIVASLISAAVALALALYSGYQAMRLRKVEAKLDGIVKSDLLEKQAGHLSKLLELAHTLIQERKEFDLQAKSKEPILREMKQLVDLMGRVKFSTGRFTHMSGTLGTDLMIEEATHTFSVIADFFARTSEHLLLALPDEVSKLIADVRRELTQYFSRIDLKIPADRFTNDLLMEAQRQLNLEIEKAQKAMRVYLAPDWVVAAEATVPAKAGGKQIHNPDLDRSANGAPAPGGKPRNNIVRP